MPEPVTIDPALVAASRRTAMLHRIASERYESWDPVDREFETGYSVLVPYPADLPALLMLALHTLATCDHKHRREVLAVADPATPSFEADTWEVPAAIADRLEGGFTTVSLDAAEAALLRADRSVSNYHSGQLIAGCRRARSRHLLLHDSDVVLTDPTFLERHYTACVEGQLACRGAEQVWDPWFAERGMAISSARGSS